MKFAKDIETLLPEEAFQFFVFFSRFEYALKRAGFLQDKSDDALAMPAWDSFANCLGSKFFEELKASNSIETILSAPPSKQIVKDNKVSWRKVDKTASIQDLFGHIRRIRNNLFHGGKYPVPDGPQKELARNATLLSEATHVLDKALSEHRSVYDIFFEDFPFVDRDRGTLGT